MVWRTDEDDFKELRSRSMEDIFDEDFRKFASWMRRTYTKKIPYAEMRRLNKRAAIDFIIAIVITLATYA